MRAANRFSRLIVLPLSLIALALACSLPGRSTPTPIAASPVPIVSPTPAASPTPLPPLPPSLVETNPPVGSDLSLAGSLTFFFNQPMDRLSVEGALTGQPGLAGRFTWQDDATLVFESDAPYPPDAELVLTLNSTARAANGLALPEPVTVSFQTAGFLRVSEVLPSPGAEEVNPAAAVVATFNQPVVPLGAPADAGPLAFTLTPATPGQGEWLNTSTYIFYPDTALFGGSNYTVSINPDLKSINGGTLAPEAAQPELRSWSFSTASPRLLTWGPDPQGSNLPLDAEFHLEFNQPMDPASVSEYLGFFDPLGMAVGGDLSWDAGSTNLTFTPDRLLARDTEYLLVLDSAAQAAGGTPLVDGIRVVYQTIPPLNIVGTDPAAGGRHNPLRGVQLRFNGPLARDLLEENISISPEVPELSTSWDGESSILYVSGFYQADTDYVLTLASGLVDPWGGVLGEAFQLAFRTDSLPPDLTLTYGFSAAFLTAEDSALTVQATNLPEVQVSVGTVPLDLFISLLGPEGYQLFENYQPEDTIGWTQQLDLIPNQNQFVDIFLSPDGQPLAPGLYFVRLNAPGLRFPPAPLLLVVSDVHLVFKLSAREAFLWAVDLQSNQSLAGIPLTLYHEDGSKLQEGFSGQAGVMQTNIPLRENLYETIYAVSGLPGDPGFALALSNWGAGVSGWDFGLPVDLSPPGLEAYLYTDRPIYRPGQTVFFRGALRFAENGRYNLPAQMELPVRLLDDQGQEIRNLVLQLSAFGTVHGEFTLPETATPGFYRLETDFGMVSLQVAEFRKPEIDMRVTLAPLEAEAGQTLVGEIKASYFFGAPAADVQVDWTLYSGPASFDLPGYQVGPLDTGWLQPVWASIFLSSGQVIDSGQGTTGLDGSLDLALTTETLSGLREYTLEVTARDESGSPVSNRTTAVVHPSQFYIGVRADAWLGQVGRELGFEVLAVDWDQSPIGNQELLAEFLKVVWVADTSKSVRGFNVPEYIPEYTLVAESTFSIDAAGQARLSFVPPEPGTYQLNIRSGRAETQVLVWVGGSGQAVWPALPNQQIRLTADQDGYQSGDVAEVFIPNPYEGGVLALITIERGEVMRHEVINLEGSGLNYQLPLGPEDAPNIYLSVTILGGNQGRPDFRQGYLNIPVEPVELALRVSLTTDPVQTGPGENVTLKFRVSDHEGNPIQAEFSLALVDLATLALAEPNSLDILSAYYGEQPLGIRNSLALAAYARQGIPQADGVGGGGGGFDTLFVREDFEDTAFWQGDLITDANGMGEVSLVLPDNLTTWRADLRGISSDTKVGQAFAEVVATKELLIRPVTPRFLVEGDHVQLAAVVHNNTDEQLETQVSLQTTGFSFDDPAAALQTLALAPGDRQRIVWWGTVEAVSGVDLVFAVESLGYTDAARPEGGLIPVLAYAAPQTFATAGTLFEAGERLELISPPRTFRATGGELQLELSPSLAAAATAALASLEATPYESNEQLVSRFLASLELFQALQAQGLDSPGLEAVMTTALSDGLARLGERQNIDGGWSWWPASRDAVPSDPYVTTYVLFGLVRARSTGIISAGASIEQAIRYVQSTMFSPEQLTEVWELDRLAFRHFVLTEAEAGDLAGVRRLYEQRGRLNPWGTAFLALALENLVPGEGRVQTLAADLQASAVRIETGAFWQLADPGWRNMDSTVFNSAVVVYALSKLDPAGALLPDSVRYLMAARSVTGGWQTTYETAWGILATTAYLRGTGELGADFAFAAYLNEVPLADSLAVPPALTPIRVTVPLADLHPTSPNALRVQREAGTGRLYYRAYLEVIQSVETVTPLVSGLQLARSYRAFGADCINGNCISLVEGQVGELISVHLNLILENDAYYLLVDERLPAGAEIVDFSLQTSQLGLQIPPLGFGPYNPARPFAAGWGWWWFSSPQIYSDRITWSADFLPAGTYELTYTLTLTQAGNYRVLPARAWQTYFPEVQGTTGGELFTVQP